MIPGAYLSLEYLLGMGTWLLLGVVALVACLRLRRLSHDRPRHKRWIDRLLGLWMLLALLTLPEGCYALFYDTTDSFDLMNTSKRWSAMHVVLNDAGYRDPHEFPPPPRSDRRLVCFVGDSFTFGHGVPYVADRFSDRVGAALEAQHPGGFHVSNIGVPGFGLRNVKHLLATDLLELDPAIGVVVYTIVLNDIDSFDEHTARYYEGINRGRPRLFLFRHTYFYNFLYFRFVQSTQPEIREYFSYLESSYAGAPWNRMKQSLAALSQLCHANGVELRVVIFPFLHNAGPDYPFLDAHKRIARFCETSGIPVLDLEPVFREHAGKNLVVNMFDAHPNERAHAIAADAIERHLLADLFALDPPARSEQ